jgi:formylglycine-generating enzyme required for sulfatase activity
MAIFLFFCIPIFILGTGYIIGSIEGAFKYGAFLDKVRTIFIGIFWLALALAVAMAVYFPTYVKISQLNKLLPTRFTPQLTYTPVPDSTFSDYLSLKDNMMLIYISAGDFLMGSQESEYYVTDGMFALSPDRDEIPQRTVFLDDFWIDKTEVTNAQYALCVKDGVCPQPKFTAVGISRYYGNPRYDTYPIINVSWDEANTYCDWAERRLPTDAEWEKAARGTDGFIFPWGNQTPEEGLLNWWVGLHSVGSYPAGASPYGVLDMAGNAWEWIEDYYEGTNDHIIRSVSDGMFYPYSTRAANRDRLINQETKLTGIRCAK